MGMEMQGQTDLLLEDADQLMRRARLADTGHVLDANNVRAGFFQLLGEADIVFEVVFAAFAVEQVTGVAQGAFAQRTRFDHRIHGDAHVVDPVQGIENAENINPIFRRLLHEVAHDVVGIIGVANRIGGA
jgi:hypothetical protein